MSEPVAAFRNALKIPELKSRIIFSLAMLAIYRLGCHIPAPGVDGARLAQQLAQSGSGFFGLYDMFTGGAFHRATVFALGIMPYITSSIILSLLIPVIPQLEALQKTGAEGQRKIVEFTRYGTIVLCVLQSIGIAIFLQNQGPEIVPNTGISFILMCILTFTTGTAFIMWVGEQISEQGIGNGMSLIIFTGIVADMPNALFRTLSLIRQQQISVLQGLCLLGLMVLVVAGAILVTTGQRRIAVQYPRQVKGRRVSGGQRTYLPLRVNQAGVIPIIFASSLLILPGMLASVPMFSEGRLGSIVHEMTDPGRMGYSILYGVLVVFFSFFYTAITFNPVEMADNMKKYGGVIIGVRPGKATAEYLNRVMVRITLVGGLALAIIALLPMLVFRILDIRDWNLVHFFGGTTLLIMVGVALDTIKQIEQHLIMRHYDGFGGTGGGRIRGRRAF